MWTHTEKKQYSTAQCSAVQCSAVQCNAMRCDAMRCDAILYNTIQYNTIQYSTVQYSTVQYNTMQYSTIQYNTIQYNTIQMCVYMCLQDVQPGGLRASGRQSRSPRSVSVHIQVRLCVSAVLTAFCVCVLQLLAEYGGLVVSFGALTLLVG